MKIPHLLLLVGKIMPLLFLLLICGAAANGTRNDEEEGQTKIQHIFDDTIEQLLKQFAPKNGIDLYLTHSNAAHILKEIEEKVVNRFMETCSAEEIGKLNFHDIMAEINTEVHDKIESENADIHKNIQVETSDPKLKEEHQHAVMKDAGKLMQLEPAKKAKLFHLLLAFANRLGKTFGKSDVNEGREKKEEKINLYKFSLAQKCLEQMHPKLQEKPSDTAGDQFIYNAVEFKNVPAKKQFKYKYTGGIQIFDKAIKQFMELIAEIESTGGSLSFNTAGHILAEIEERVANKFVAKCTGGYPNDDEKMNFNFHGILSTIIDTIRQNVQQRVQPKMDQTSNRKLFDIDVNENAKHFGRPEENAELFHLLLTFAIRLGFNIGHMELNSGGNDHQIHLHQFIHAQNCMEEMHLILREQSWYHHVVVFEIIPSEPLIRLDYSTPDDPWKWNAWTDYSLGTIKWFLPNPLGWPIEEWLSLVRIMAVTNLNGRHRVSEPKDPQIPMDRLMVTWSRSFQNSSYNIDLVVFCALKTFSRNLAKRLIGLKTVQNYLAGNQEAKQDLVQKLGELNAQHEANCSDKDLKESIDTEKEQYEVLVRREPFVHYEDAIPYNELKTFEDYRQLADQWIKPRLLEWPKKIGKCKYTGSSKITSECTEVINEIENWKMPRDQLGREINGFFRVKELGMVGMWINFLIDYNHLHNKLVREMKEMNAGMAELRKSTLTHKYQSLVPESVLRHGLLLSAGKKKTLKEINVLGKLFDIFIISL